MQTQCPICDATIIVDQNTEVAEIIACNECKNKLEVTEKNGDKINLKEAPKVEEDWGQ